ncbi:MULTISPECIES: hypothetical protein [unclassified Pseudoalteromonas]|uniref:hypothetical protein n=1 Tax=unclassified Pseudoalteromonas TaxID=194690 RepID=UPI0006CA00E5|nr:MULTISPECIES: hypothetical protein [unclassified Pseudoalteromonas]KPM79886.1 hypothetical protein AOG26_00940 [Pseudoalteromonas sp. UCD-33C]KPW02056.1 hypothetical protein AN213_01517 [Pseudoalteromonas sp. P1-8]
MTKKPSPLPTDTNKSEPQREDFYRACIAEFQQLGYQDQYLAELTDELIPLTGLEPLSDKEKTAKG